MKTILHLITAIKLMEAKLKTMIKSMIIVIWIHSFREMNLKTLSRRSIGVQAMLGPLLVSATTEHSF